MNKFAIFQLDYYIDKTSKKYQYFMDYFVPSVRKYSKKYDIDYKLIRYSAPCDYSYNEKISLYKQIVNTIEYTKILYLDIDIFIKINSPNIFDLNTEHISACVATRKRFDFGIQFTKKKLLKNEDNFWKLENCSIRPNTGVVLFNRENINHNIFSSSVEDSIEDEMYLAYKIAYKNLCLNILPPSWNQRNLNLIRESYFIHVLSNLFDADGIDTERGYNLKELIDNFMAA